MLFMLLMLVVVRIAAWLWSFYATSGVANYMQCQIHPDSLLVIMIMVILSHHTLF